MVSFKIGDKIKIIKNFSVSATDYSNKLYTIMCDKGHNYTTNYDLISKRDKYNVEKCTICNPVGVKYSGNEKLLIDFIKDNYSGKIIENDRNIIQPYELDIYLPELKIAIEYNGLYWHSELYRDKKYHKMKHDMCVDKGVTLFQIFEDDWLYNENIVKSMILNKLNKTPNRIYARSCKIKEIFDNESVNFFLLENHIQGKTNSSIKLGLYYDNVLVSIMCFIKKNNDTYELNRFCNKIYTNVIGGASKLFSHFINNYEFKNITSFSNNLYSDGGLYHKIGFKKLNQIKEDYQYIVNGKRYHKFNFRKKDNRTERDMNLQENRLRIYDAGKIKFIYSL